MYLFSLLFLKEVIIDLYCILRMYFYVSRSSTLMTGEPRYGKLNDIQLTYNDSSKSLSNYTFFLQHRISNFLLLFDTGRQFNVSCSMCIREIVLTDLTKRERERERTGLHSVTNGLEYLVQEISHLRIERRKKRGRVLQ